MDQDTRNALQRATQKIRQILEDEFAEQLEGMFDILANGSIAPEPGAHLDATQRLTRRKLVDAIEHIKAIGKKADVAIDEYKREAAFTFLNRFVALRMLESRGLLQECVSKGDESSGFKEFCGLASGLSALPDGGYRLYLESLCDELSVEVKVLFDRRDTASVLWPRRNALSAILEVLSESTISSVWDQDETIGWVYQDFNSSDERKEMREAKAPGNSRELAVRNQFFTPRYVVEYLVDNTLGRMWYEMHDGQSSIVDVCQQMICRPNEVFGGDADAFPPDSLKIDARAKKDPRDIKVLDPACGSGHFLLYAFDVLTAIYEEAWRDEDSAAFGETGNRLDEDYESIEELRSSIPGLILRHNLYGIDIDPRAAQVATLSIWIRAQKAFRDHQTAAARRIRESRIAFAEPMPGEPGILNEFLNQHLDDSAESKVLGELVRRAFDAMKQADELGSLLRVEAEIEEVVQRAKRAWAEKPQAVQQLLFGDHPPSQPELPFDIHEITDEQFWDSAEKEIYKQLTAYQAQRNLYGFQARLFVDDAERGFAFINTCRERFDVVLMNPPFGEPVPATKEYLKATYPWIPSKDYNLFAAFVGRGIDLLCAGGMLGAITSRAGFFLKTYQRWRQDVILTNQLECVADLGFGIMQGAYVEAAAYVISRKSSTPDYLPVFFRLLKSTEREASLLNAVRAFNEGENDETAFPLRLGELSKIPGSPFSYWVADGIRNLFKRFDSLEDTQTFARQGLATGDDFRFIRTWWEVPRETLGEPTGFTEKDCWAPFAKGGDYAPYHNDVHLVVAWRNNGIEMKSFPKSVVRNKQFYFRKGLVWNKRTASGFCPAYWTGGIFSSQGPAVIAPEDVDLGALSVVLNSRLIRAMIECMLAAAEATSSGTPARHYEVGIVSQMPSLLNEVSHELYAQLSSVGQLLREVRAYQDKHEETSIHFLSPAMFWSEGADIDSRILSYLDERDAQISQALSTLNVAEKHLMDELELSDSSVSYLADEMGENPAAYSEKEALTDFETRYRQGMDDLIDGIIEEVGGSRILTTKCFQVDRRTELLSHYYSAPSDQVIRERRDRQIVRDVDRRIMMEDIVSWALGCSLGRWSASHGRKIHEVCLRDGLPGVEEIEFLSPIVDVTVGIRVDDEGHPADLIPASIDALNQSFDARSRDKLISTLSAELFGSDRLSDQLRLYFRSSAFEDHIGRYTRSRRRAPIYWQLATPSAAYSVWLYYHRFTKDTFFKVLNEYVKPKIDHERQKLDRLRGEAGAEPTRSQRKEIEDQEKFVAELAAMVEEVEWIAPLWNPNLNDGAIINFAPLWRLVPQNKKWQKECKKVWDKLVDGDYDWAHLAMHLWPERVIPKCVTDASLAIAHGLEEPFWTQDDRDRFQPLEEPDGGWQPIIDNLVEERTSPAVKAALESLLNAPAPVATTRRSGRSRR